MKLNQTHEEMIRHFEQAKQKFNDILQNYSFVYVDSETISVKLK